MLRVPAYQLPEAPPPLLEPPPPLFDATLLDGLRAAMAPAQLDEIVRTGLRSCRDCVGRLLGMCDDVVRSLSPRWSAVLHDRPLPSVSNLDA